MADHRFIIKLIQSVQKHPCLWDPSSESYGKREKTEKSWQEVAEECEKPVFFCRDKWKNVRTGFLRSLREYPENSTVASSPYRRKPFYLHEHMRFLLPSILRTDSSTKTNPPNCVVVESNEMVKIEDSSNSELLDYEGLDNFENVEVIPNEGYFYQFRTSSSNQSEVLEKYVETVEPPDKKFKFTNDNDAVRETKEELALMSFFKGITSDVLSLSAKNQRFFKRKIVELVDELHNAEERMETIPKQQCINY